MTPEADAWVRVDNELARRVSIQASVARKTDELVRMMDPVLRYCSHAEHVRRLVVMLGDIGALDPSSDEPELAPAWSMIEQLQEALTDFQADVQAWQEQILRDASR